MSKRIKEVEKFYGELLYGLFVSNHRSHPYWENLEVTLKALTKEFNETKDGNVLRELDLVKSEMIKIRKQYRKSRGG